MLEKDVTRWLREGEQSKATHRIKKIVSQFKGNEFEKLFQILSWIDNNLHTEKSRKKVLAIFTSRTADEVLVQKNDTGCHDSALLVATFLRAVGIPVRYVIGIDKPSLGKGGHVVVEAYVIGRWILIDPSYFRVDLLPERSSFYKTNYVYKKGLDSWDCGIRTVAEWDKASRHLIARLKK